MDKTRLIGRKFNYLTVLSFAFIRNQSSYWKCLCDCGKKKIICGGNLTNGHTKSCGCFNVKRAIETNTIHNLCHTIFYKKWAGMIQRCSNKNNKRYSDWGGRGITFDKKWKVFTNFRDDMYNSYLIHLNKFGKEQTTLDRIDNNGNYCKSNCRWTTIKEQNSNKRKYKLKPKTS